MRTFRIPCCNNLNDRGYTSMHFPVESLKTDFHLLKQNTTGGLRCRLCGLCSCWRQRCSQTTTTFLYVSDSIELIKEDKKSLGVGPARFYPVAILSLLKHVRADSCISLWAHKKVSVSRRRGSERLTVAVRVPGTRTRGTAWAGVLWLWNSTEFSIEEKKCGGTKASIHTERFKKGFESAEFISLGLKAELEFNQFINHLLSHRQPESKNLRLPKLY